MVVLRWTIKRNREHNYKTKKSAIFLKMQQSENTSRMIQTNLTAKPNQTHKKKQLKENAMQHWIKAFWKIYFLNVFAKCCFVFCFVVFSDISLRCWALYLKPQTTSSIFFMLFHRLSWLPSGKMGHMCDTVLCDELLAALDPANLSIAPLYSKVLNEMTYSHDCN